MKNKQADLKNLFENGYGYFDPNSHDYKITLDRKPNTPLPWVNVIANPNFGTMVTESGASFTWFKNSYLFRLTPWINDPVTERSGELIFLRDESNNQVWSPTSSVSERHVDGSKVIVSHGHGYTSFESRNHELSQNLKIFLAKDQAIKFFELTIKNDSTKVRKLSATCFVQWVLGDFAEKNRFYVEQQFDQKESLIISYNPLTEEFSDNYGFLGTFEKNVSVTLDRTAFWGRNNKSNTPEFLKRKSINYNISNEALKPNDPGAALQIFFEIPAKEKITVVFYLGAGLENKSSKITSNARESYKKINRQESFWSDKLSQIQIATPNPALNTLWNEQLLYQIVNSRFWGRAAFYQPGGAFGFRDQLQDCMALVWAMPELSREHILLAASRQFLEGDVQHWWHPPLGRGVRSESSDAHLWLPQAALYYSRVSGDEKIWQEQVYYLSAEGAENKPGDYFIPGQSQIKESLYQHCLKAIDLTLSRMGSHGLPLMLKGDWNDSLNNVGAAGKGESVWLAFFLGKILKDFIPIVEKHKDLSRRTEYVKVLASLGKLVNEIAWDGQWFIRAFWDDGQKLGSANNLECKIDSLSQTWAVISGIADSDKMRTAMAAVEKYLVDQENHLVSVLKPAFKKSDPTPGYAQTYPVGMRENGGSYTHAALWVAQAWALLGDGDKALNVLDMSNPFIRSETFEKASQYAAEPYVLASDITTQGSHLGRAGWTWYTGSAGVYYVVVLENILGIQKKGQRLFFNPCVPKDWTDFSAAFKYKSSVYNLSFENPDHLSSGVSSVAVDSVENKSFLDQGVLLKDDGKTYNLKIVLGKS